jgi:hypothetical protein
VKRAIVIAVLALVRFTHLRNPVASAVAGHQPDRPDPSPRPLSLRARIRARRGIRGAEGRWFNGIVLNPVGVLERSETDHRWRVVLLIGSGRPI